MLLARRFDRLLGEMLDQSPLPAESLEPVAE
jgi:hypothetical protein